MATSTKQVFRSAYSGQVRKHAPAGEEEYPVYEYEIDSKGKKKLVVTGYKNRFEEIQAEAEDVKIENVLKRLAVGDMSDFRPDGIYQDISEMPTSMLEARQIMQNLENTWNKLPTELKEKYNFSLDEFISKSGEEAWLIDMGYMQPKNPENVTSEALKVETKPEVPENE